jgi:catechol 2,3-dioxygenase-like lactoylglutathione lyase family enzyme
MKWRLYLMTDRGGVQGQITFLYYHEIEPAARFYEEVLGFDLVEDQGWAKIYRIADSAYLGVVAGDKAYHTPQEKNAVLVTVVVGDALQWYDTLKRKRVPLLSELEHREEIGIRCFFLEDPGGYTLEVQQFLRPEQVEVFGGAQEKDPPS